MKSLFWVRDTHTQICKESGNYEDSFFYEVKK